MVGVVAHTYVFWLVMGVDVFGGGSDVEGKKLVGQ